MNIYADESFYKDEYLLDRAAVITTAYAYFFREASSIIDAYTFGNIDPDNVPETVKMCCCEIAESIQSRDKQLLESGGVQSESVSGWSKTYSSSNDIQTAFEASCKYIVYKWLAGSGLLYSGVK